jgi:hypothetical protein
MMITANVITYWNKRVLKLRYSGMQSSVFGRWDQMFRSNLKEEAARSYATLVSANQTTVVNPVKMRPR